MRDEYQRSCRRKCGGTAEADTVEQVVTSWGQVTPSRCDLDENCIPMEFMETDIFDYALFLDTRRTMMALYIRDYYRSLD